jgi:hypothetical protein
MFGMNFLLGREASGSIASESVRRSRAPRVLLSAIAGLSLLSGMTAMQPAPAAAAAAIPALPVPLFFQQDSRWSGDPIGKSCSQKMLDQGCAVTSVAMVYAYFGMVWTQGGVTGMDPKIVAKYVPGCEMNWTARGFSDKIAASSVDPSNPTLVLNQLRAGRPVIAQVHNTYYTKITMHFVVITGWTGSQYIVNNPDKSLQGYLGAQHYVIDYYHTVNTAVIGNNVFTVDDSTSGFSHGGSPNVANNVGYAARTIPTSAGVHWSYGVTSSATVAANWVFTIPAAGTWALYVWVPNMYSSTLNAKYTVDTGTTTIITMAQSPYFDQWALIGSFSIAANYQAWVMLGNNTGETNRTIAFDAIMWKKIA